MEYRVKYFSNVGICIYIQNLRGKVVPLINKKTGGFIPKPTLIHLEWMLFIF